MSWQSAAPQRLSCIWREINCENKLTYLLHFMMCAVSDTPNDDRQRKSRTSSASILPVLNAAELIEVKIGCEKGRYKTILPSLGEL